MATPGNVGHGHVFKRPDGMVARCGGPNLCRECWLDQNRLEAMLGREERASGCVCPPTSEQTCQSFMCPRKGVSAVDAMVVPIKVVPIKAQDDDAVALRIGQAVGSLMKIRVDGIKAVLVELVEHHRKANIDLVKIDENGEIISRQAQITVDLGGMVFWPEVSQEQRNKD